MVHIRIKSNPVEVRLSLFEVGQIKDKGNYEIYDTVAKCWVELGGCRYLEPGRGYSSTDDAFMPITAISIHLQWLDKLICLAVPPATLTWEAANELVKDIPNVILYKTEAEVLDTFLSLIEDADVLSGWNSGGYDIPYTVNRVREVLGKTAIKRFCLWDQTPREREYEKFGKTSTTYDLVGRVHLDSLELYQKYTYEERPSFRLDAIGEYEVGENKTQYEGTLDELYNNDFHRFIEYNIQDTALLNKLDKKLQFINTASVLAHANTVLLQTTMGAVAVSEQAIINEAHLLGFRLPDRKKRQEGEATQAAGAYVAYPKKGLHDWIGSLDINSLYPSDIRALNMSPETIVGQIRQDLTDAYILKKMSSATISEKKKGDNFAKAWEGIFGSLEYTHVMNKDASVMLTIDWEDGNSSVLSAAEIYQLVFEGNNNITLSANGTLFSYDQEGIIPGLLKKWYEERKHFQRILKNLRNLEAGITVPEALLSQVEKLLES